MRRSRLPLDQRAALMRSRAALEQTQRDRAAAAGQAAGMPRFLNQAATTGALSPEAGEVAAEPTDEDLDALLPHEDTAVEEPIQRMAEGDGADLAEDLSPEPLPDVSGEGIEAEVSAYSVTLRGRTDAKFSSSFRTRNVRTTAATGCACEGECVHATGTLVSTFRVTTTVTLPSVSDFPDLTACQRQRVRDGINNVLRPHEQEHVTAFRTYNGTVSTPFDLTLCRSEFDSQIQALHDSVEAPRQAAAQAASDALDPFEFEVDLDCED